MALEGRTRRNRIIGAGAAVACAAAGTAVLALRGRTSPLPAAARPSETRWVERLTRETRAGRPNILLVVYDARRRDDFSFGPQGNRRNDTPFLGGLAKESLYFEEAVSPGCWTVPVHASIFSGLSVCDLGIDYYNPGVQSFSSRFLSLAEVLHLAGYRTIAYADHPFFYNQDLRVSLLRGFEQFSVLNEFKRFGSHSNVDTSGGESVLRPALREAPGRSLSWSEFAAEVARFNQGKLRVDVEREADYDPETGLHLAKIGGLFRESPYLGERYAGLFDQQLLADPTRPYFFFLNLHIMSSAGLPDPRLYWQWYLKTLMINAQVRRMALDPGSEEAGVRDAVVANLRRLDFRHPRFRGPEYYLNHVYDNRFYDATFRGIWEQLTSHGLTRDTVVIVTSDHGLSLGENGEPLYTHNGARPYEYMTRVPLLLRFPAQGEQHPLSGRRSERVSLTDLFPTIVQLGAGRDVFQRSALLRGRSLVDRVEKGAFDPVVVAECSLQPFSYHARAPFVGYSKAIYSGGLKLIVVPDPFELIKEPWPIARRVEPGFPFFSASLPDYRRVGEPFRLLYDLSADPHETKDLARDRPADVARLEGLVPLSCDARLGEAGRAVWSGDALEALRSLGYVQ